MGNRARVKLTGMKTNSRVHRLPGYDRPTGRWELLVFVSLGFVGIWLAASAVRQAGDFASERDAIAATLSGEPTLAVHPANTNHALTNLSALPCTGGTNRPFCAGIGIRPS